MCVFIYLWSVTYRCKSTFLCCQNSVICFNGRCVTDAQRRLWISNSSGAKGLNLNTYYLIPRLLVILFWKHLLTKNLNLHKLWWHISAVNPIWWRCSSFHVHDLLDGSSLLRRFLFFQVIFSLFFHSICLFFAVPLFWCVAKLCFAVHVAAFLSVKESESREACGSPDLLPWHPGWDFTLLPFQTDAYFGPLVLLTSCRQKHDGNLSWKLLLIEIVDINQHIPSSCFLSKKKEDVPVICLHADPLQFCSTWIKRRWGGGGYL